MYSHNFFFWLLQIKWEGGRRNWPSGCYDWTRNLGATLEFRNIYTNTQMCLCVGVFARCACVRVWFSSVAGFFFPPVDDKLQWMKNKKLCLKRLKDVHKGRGHRFANMTWGALLFWTHISQPRRLRLHRLTWVWRSGSHRLQAPARQIHPKGMGSHHA